MRALALLSLLLPGTAAAEQRRIQLTEFTAIRVQGPFEVEVTGGAPAAVVEAQTDDLDRPAIRVQDDVLVIGINPDAWGSDSGRKPGSIRIRISAPELSAASVSGKGKLSLDHLRGDAASLSVQGAGTLAVQNIRLHRLTVIGSGVGSITLAGQADEAQMRALLQIDLDADGLTLRDATLYAQDADSVRLSATGTAAITNAGPGDVTVAGPAQCIVKGKAPVTCAGRK